MAFVAFASAAPSNIVAPIVPAFAAVAPALAAVQVPEIIAPTIGDAEALATDLKVKAEDTAREFFEKNEEIVERNVQAINENNRQIADNARELSEELFWNNEDKKWQAYDAAKTAESELDGAASAIGPVVATRSVIQPLAPTVLAPAPAVIAHSPAVVAAAPFAYYQPEKHTISEQYLSQTHPAPAVKFAVAEPTVKLAPALPIVEPVAEVKPIINEVPVLAEPILKAAPIIEPAKQTIVTQELSQTHPAPLHYFAPIPAQPIFRYAEPYYASTAYFQPGFNSISAHNLYQYHGLEYAKFVQPIAPIAFAAPVFKPELVATEQKVIA